MKIYRIADEQLELFEEPKPEQQPEQQPEEPQRETEGPDIELTQTFTDMGAHFAVFRIGNRYYSYRLSFPDWLKKARQISRHSGARALAWVKEKASETLEVTKDYPMYGSILREVN
jgi:hypothetical protein